MGRIQDVTCTLSWQEFAKGEAPGLTGVQIQESESKDTQGIHRLVVLQEGQDPIWIKRSEKRNIRSAPKAIARATISGDGTWNPSYTLAKVLSSISRVKGGSSGHH